MSTTDEKFARLGRYGSVILALAAIGTIAVSGVRWFDDAEENHEEDVIQGERLTAVEGEIVKQRAVLFRDAFDEAEAEQKALERDAKAYREQQRAR